MTKTPPIPAEEITDALLTQTGEALDRGDFDAFAECFHLPHRITSWDCERVIETREELEETFNSVRRAIRASGAEQTVRYIDSARYRNPTTIVSTHISQSVNGTMRLEDPYPVLSIVELIDGRWLIKSSDYAVSASSPKGRAIVPAAIKSATNEADHAKD